MHIESRQDVFFTAQQILELERFAIQGIGIESYVLMQRAGAAVFREVLNVCDSARSLLVLCGVGNNGGDGYIVAMLARQAGFAVTVVVPESELEWSAQLQCDAQKAAQSWREAGGDIVSVEGIAFDHYDCIVDALFGTGLQRPLDAAHQKIIAAINMVSAPVIAVDVPSGLHANTGCPMPCAIRASVTVTFIGLKQGLLMGYARDYVGRIVLNELGMPEEVYARVSPAGYCINDALRRSYLSPRMRTGHKGLYGHVLIVGGDTGMSGAACMAGIAALRVGAGRVSLATRSSHAAVLSSLQPELMSHAVETPAELQPLLENASVVVIGPGLGQQRWGCSMLDTVLQSKKPVIVDADGLNLLAKESCRRQDWILTPHPGEAARLLDMSTQQVEADRYAALAALADHYQAVVVLKGTATLVASTTAEIFVCGQGNPGMASGGMGDVLTGVIAGLVAQRIPLEVAARLGVYLHACAGDQAAQRGERGTLASDLFLPLRELANPLQM